jgi:hypothetical protein
MMVAVSTVFTNKMPLFTNFTTFNIVFFSAFSTNSSCHKYFTFIMSILYRIFSSLHLFYFCLSLAKIAAGRRNKTNQVQKNIYDFTELKQNLKHLSIYLQNQCFCAQYIHFPLSAILHIQCKPGL